MEKIETIEICEIGNTKSHKSSKKQEIQYKNWVFTLNNYTENEIRDLKLYLNEFSEKAIVGFEVGAQGTQHLQGYFTLYKKVRLTEFKKLDCLKRAHIEKCNNTKASEIYCQKENNICFKKGKITKKLKIIENLKQWQSDVYDIILKEPDDRNIIWIFEKSGNVGKSAFIKYVLTNNNFCCGFCDGGKKADVINMVFNLKDDPDIVFIDLPRENEGHISYSAVESLKNGTIFNSKFETGFRLFNPPHVIIFSNYEPADTSYLSADRWKIYEIIDDKLLFRTLSSPPAPAHN